jgi:hypothetical protein
VGEKLTRLTHKIAIQLHLVAESCTTWSSRSRWPVRKHLEPLLYVCTLRKNLYIKMYFSSLFKITHIRLFHLFMWWLFVIPSVRCVTVFIVSSAVSCDTTIWSPTQNFHSKRVTITSLFIKRLGEVDLWGDSKGVGGGRAFCWSYILLSRG